MKTVRLPYFCSSPSEQTTSSLDPNACRPNDNTSPMISLEEASQWLVSMAATDGVVSASESKLLKAFAKCHNIDYNALLTKARAIADGIDVPEVETVDIREMKGRIFEEFIVSLCFDKSRFRLLAWRGDKISGNTYALDTLMPDLHIRHFIDGSTVEYYIECKYRTTLTDDTLDLSSQLGRYRRMSSAKTNSELFLAIGLGGTPSNPDELYIIPSRMIKKDYIIKLKNFSKCRCAQDPESFHNYINHFYQKRVYKKL